MKIILSRKGFDSSNGGFASPIFPDGTLLSLPIPQDSDSGCEYSDISFKYENTQYTYEEIIHNLTNKNPKKYCHLDPDIREVIRKENISNWKAAFGPDTRPHGILRNAGVNEDDGDLFLFFGWFKWVEYLQDKNKWGYNTKVHDDIGQRGLHVIYGYMQIDKIINSRDKPNEFIDKIHEYKWHPHLHNVDPSRIKDLNETLYLPKQDKNAKLTIYGHETDFPAYGTLHYRENCVLTGMDMDTNPPSRFKDWYKWKWFDWMNVGDKKFKMTSQLSKQTYGKNKIQVRVPNKYFLYNPGYCQESVILYNKDNVAENKELESSVVKWAVNDVIKNGWIERDNKTT
jgi:hypothetical protein